MHIVAGPSPHPLKHYPVKSTTISKLFHLNIGLKKLLQEKGEDRASNTESESGAGDVDGTGGTSGASRAGFRRSRGPSRGRARSAGGAAGSLSPGAGAGAGDSAGAQVTGSRGTLNGAGADHRHQSGVQAYRDAWGR